MNAEPNYMGYDGFIWWMGVVEDRQDPLKLGRCRVRIVGAHTADKSLIPTNELPWAYVMLPVTDSSMLMIKEGDYVIGFYLDGPNAQHPVIMGILPGIPDQQLPPNVGFTDPRGASELTTSPRPPASLSVSGLPGEPVTITETPNASRYPANLNEPTISRLARNDSGNSANTIITTKKSLTLKSIPVAGGGTFSEPDSSYAAQYPYNRVIESESGHVIEIDDTPGKERIHIYHRSGTAIEINPDGTYVSRVNSDKYDVILSDNNIFVNGDCNLTVNKNLNLKSGADLNIEVEKSVNIKAGKGVNIQSGTSLSMQSQGPAILQSQGSLTLFSTGSAILQGSTSQIQPGSAEPISGLLLGPDGVPIKINSTIATVSGVQPLVTPSPSPAPEVPIMSDAGNQDLAGRPGTKVDPAHPVERYTDPVETPTDLPPPTVANTASNTVSTVVSSGDVMVRAMNRAKIQDSNQRAMIWAQTYHESGGFKKTIESTAYRRETLLKIFPSYFNTSNVDQYVGDGGVKWPSRAYGKRMGNGDESTGDGYTYRGRGFIQLTGKANYLKAGRAFNQDFVNYPDAMRTPDLAADVAIWYFQRGGRGTGYKGSYTDVTTVTKFVNGGTIGLTERAQLFEKAKTKPEVITYNSSLI